MTDRTSELRLNNVALFSLFSGTDCSTGDSDFCFSTTGGAATVTGSKNRRCVEDDIFIDFNFFVSNEIDLILFVIISLVSPGTLKMSFYVNLLSAVF